MDLAKHVLFEVLGLMALGKLLAFEICCDRPASSPCKVLRRLRNNILKKHEIREYMYCEKGGFIYWNILVERGIFST